MSGPSKKFLRKISIFLAPIILIVGGVLSVGLVSGEFFPVKFPAWLVKQGKPFLYLPKFSDHNFRFKVEATRFIDPKILVLGPSRANQWRSSMFTGTFYNAAQSVYTFKDYRQFIEELGDNTPEVMIVSVDYYNFNPDWNEMFRTVNKTDIGASDILSIGMRLYEELLEHPNKILRFQEDPIYGIPAIGLSAGEWGAGFRIDGSFQYGQEIQGNNEKTVSVENVLNRIENNVAPFQQSDALDGSSFSDFVEFVELAKSKNIAVIAVTMPYMPIVIDSIETSPRHQSWRDFRSVAFKNRLVMQDILYFDFADIDSFGGNTEEFVDPFHPSETAVLRILLKMIEDPEIASLLATATREELETKLANATKLEVFRNQF